MKPDDRSPWDDDFWRYEPKPERKPGMVDEAHPTYVLIFGFVIGLLLGIALGYIAVSVLLGAL